MTPGVVDGRVANGRVFWLQHWVFCFLVVFFLVKFRKAPGGIWLIGPGQDHTLVLKK